MSESRQSGSPVGLVVPARKMDSSRFALIAGRAGAMMTCPLDEGIAKSMSRLLPSSVKKVCSCRLCGVYRRLPTVRHNLSFAKIARW